MEPDFFKLNGRKIYEEARKKSKMKREYKKIDISPFLYPIPFPVSLFSWFPYKFFSR